MRIPLVLLLFFFSSGLLLEAQMRTFRNQFGQSFPAQIVEVRGDNIVLELPGGARETMPVASLSARDQQFVRQWDQLRLIGQQFSVAISPQRRNVALGEPPLHRGSYNLMTYGIELRNSGSRTLTDIRVVYRLHFMEADPRSTGREVRRVKELSETVNELVGHRRITVTTQAIALRNFTVPDGVTLAGSTRRTLEDRELGVEVEIFSGETRITRVTYPDNLDRLLR